MLQHKYQQFLTLKHLIPLYPYCFKLSLRYRILAVFAATSQNTSPELPNLTNFSWDSQKLDKSHALLKVQWISRIFVNTLCVHVCSDYLLIEIHSRSSIVCTYMYKKCIIVYVFCDKFQQSSLLRRKTFTVDVMIINGNGLQIQVSCNLLKLNTKKCRLA